MSDALEARLLAAHSRGDHAALVLLYEEAALAAPDDAAARFFLTHAYVFALETGHDATARLRRQLVDLGAEPPDPG